ncbi:MAG: AI-2E family transporter [Candidatus Paceibacterota bacterium]|jgi:predicted PurR-regulated permease PerM
MEKNQRQTIEISSVTIFKTLAVIALIFFAFLIRNVLVILFFALIIASTASLPVNWLKKHRIPKTIGTIIVYFLAIAFIGFLLTIIITPLAGELKQLSNFMPNIADKLSSSIVLLKNIIHDQSQFQEFFVSLSEKISQFSFNIFSVTEDIVGRVASFIVVFILSFYLTIEQEGVRKIIRTFIPEGKRDYAINIWERAQKKMSRWFGSQLLLGLVVGLMTFIGLTILQIPYALALSVLAGIFELVPTVGPILSAIPAIAIAFIESPILALITLGLYIIIQQLENHLLVPKIMQKTTGLNPVITILAILVGVKLGGILGMILAIPITMLISEFSSDIFGLTKFQKSKPK